MKKALQRYPEWKKTMPFDIVAKHQERSYSVAQVINGIIPTLQHGHDGLIFTCVESAYMPGTDENILKWKPPNENSIDFKLALRFPARTDKDDTPDMREKPVFLLHQWLGGDKYDFFDEMEVDDDEWER
jgi:mRNA guanylyltransferase